MYGCHLVQCGWRPTDGRICRGFLSNNCRWLRLLHRNTGRYGCHLGPMPLATSEFRRGLASFSNFVRLSCLDENRGAAQFGVKSGFLRLSRIRPGSCHLLEFRPAFFARTKTEEVAQFQPSQAPSLWGGSSFIKWQPYNGSRCVIHVWLPLDPLRLASSGPNKDHCFRVSET